MKRFLPDDFTFVSSGIELKLRDLQDFLRVTGDTSIFHVNEKVSKKSFFKKTVSSGFLTLGHLVQSTWEMWRKHQEVFQGMEIIQMDLSARFTKPVFIGDTVCHHWSLIKQKKHRLGMKVKFRVDIKRGDEVVAEVTRTLLYVDSKKKKKK